MMNPLADQKENLKCKDLLDFNVINQYDQVNNFKYIVVTHLQIVD